MHIRPVLLIVGAVLLGFALVMLVPALVAAWSDESTTGAFLKSAAITAVVAGAMVAAGFHARVLIYPKQTFVITTTVWVAVSAFGALPFVFYAHIDYSDAVFETMSGITTTGSTVLVGLDSMPRSVLIWRSLLQWVGGLGFTVMAIAILPFLGVGGMRLFRSESSEWTDKGTPRVRSLALSISACYLLLSVTCALAYWAGGMSAFDSINHAMSTISTGGYSTHDASFGHFDSAMLEATAVVFMIAGALPFALYVRSTKDGGHALVNDQQVRGFLKTIVAVVGVIATWRALRSDDSFVEALRDAAFNVLSVITTTGFASTDYGSWGEFATMAFFLLTFVGGCSGSTAGAFKIFRFQIALGVLRSQMLRLIHPHAVQTREFNGRPVGDDVLRSLVGFSFAFFATIVVLAVSLTLFDLDFLTSISTAATMVTNVGPGLGPIVGPAGNFASLPDPAKWLLSAGMLLGRLEIMTVIVLLNRRFWRS